MARIFPQFFSENKIVSSENCKCNTLKECFSPNEKPEKRLDCNEALTITLEKGKATMGKDFLITQSKLLFG
jgi:hypothetical protein